MHLVACSLDAEGIIANDGEVVDGGELIGFFLDVLSAQEFWLKFLDGFEQHIVRDIEGMGPGTVGDGSFVDSEVDLVEDGVVGSGGL